MTGRAEEAIKAFHQYRQTGDEKHVLYLERKELLGIVGELARFKDDWFYPMMLRRLEELKETPHEEKKKTFTEKLKGLW